jgi:NAD(P)-dependent dehydrogenase (short-subunit alcohol dehydrogenase family)
MNPLDYGPWSTVYGFSMTGNTAGKLTAVVTGASSGIGEQLAQALSAAGIEVIVVGRSADRTRAVANRLKAEHHVVDFAELDQVRELGTMLAHRHPHLDVLMNNAGGVAGARIETVDGFEWTFQVNHLAPFLLTNMLHTNLAASRGRVIVTASTASTSRMARIDFADLQPERGYRALRAYSVAKLANVLFARELARRWAADGIAAASAHPGVVASRFGSASTLPVRAVVASPLRRLMRSPAEGADTLVWLANAPRSEWMSGEYFADRAVARSNPIAADATVAARLWETSERLVAATG